MYAVIETGGKQYRVEVGTELEVELLDVEPGQSITLERVLLVADGTEAAVGNPLTYSITISLVDRRADTTNAAFDAGSNLGSNAAGTGERFFYTATRTIFN